MSTGMDELVEAHGKVSTRKANGGDDPPPGQPPGPLLPPDFTVDSLEGVPVPPREWHVPGLIPSSTATLLSANGGEGKTILALQLGCATAGNCDWIGRGTPRQGRVFYLSAEEDRDELHRRVADIATFYGKPLSAFAGFRLWPVVERDAVLAQTSGRGDRVETTPLWAEFEERLADWKPSLIIVDPSANVFAINENDRSQTVQVVNLLRGVARRHSAAALLNTHPSLSGMASGSGTSGSTGWNNAARSRLYLTRPSSRDGAGVDPDLRLLTVMKANFSAAGGELRLRYSCGAFVGETGGGGSSALSVAVARERIDARFLEMLDAYEAQGRRVSATPSVNFAPSVFAKDPQAEGMRSDALREAMNRLFKAGELKNVEEGPPSRRRSRIARLEQ